MECPRQERSSKHRSALMQKQTPRLLHQSKRCAMAYDEAIVKYHQPRIKFNFPEGMPIEDQSDDDDGFWA